MTRGATGRFERDYEFARSDQQASILRRHRDPLPSRLRQQAERMRRCGVRSPEPELVDVVRRARLHAQAVGRNLMGGAGEADRPNRVLLAIPHHRDDRHARKVGCVTSYERGDQKGERQSGEDARRRQRRALPHRVVITAIPAPRAPIRDAALVESASLSG